jgi:hypothetical protein
MKFFIRFTLCGLFIIGVDARQLIAQDDLLKVLESQYAPRSEKVIATFKGDKVINVETNETVRKANLDFRVSHLFGNVGEESGGGIHNLYGIDQSSDIRIGFHYGLTDRLMLGVSRAKRLENLEGLVKYKLLEQCSDNSIPLALTLYANATYSLRAGNLFEKNIHRLTYFYQLILARKFSSRFSFVLSPGLLHRNFVANYEENNTFSLSGGLRYKFTRSSSIITDYSHAFGRNNLPSDDYDVLGAGLEIETGGHVFSIMFSNASGILENDFLVNTRDSWSKGGFKLSFIISRMFPFRKEDESKNN